MNDVGKIIHPILVLDFHIRVTPVTLATILLPVSRGMAMWFNAYDCLLE